MSVSMNQIAVEAAASAKESSKAQVEKTARMAAENAAAKEDDYQKAAQAYDRIYSFVIESLMQKTYQEHYRLAYERLLAGHSIHPEAGV